MDPIDDKSETSLPLPLVLLTRLPFLLFSSSSSISLMRANRIAPSRDKRSRSGKMRERRTTLAITIPYAIYIYIFFFSLFYSPVFGCPLAFRRFRRSSDCATARRPMFSIDRSFLDGALSGRAPAWTNHSPSLRDPRAIYFVCLFINFSFYTFT